MRSPGKPDKSFWLSAFRSDAALLLAAATPDTLDDPVPTRPDWRLRDLVWHLTNVYTWVGGHVARGRTDRPPAADPAEPAPPDAAAVLERWEAAYRELERTLDGVDAELPAWNWAPQPKTAAFWHRRMAHDTAVHRWDVQVATGATEPVEAKLAADGIHEVLDSWLPAGRGHDPAGVTGVAHLVASDLEHDWYVRFRGRAVALLDTSTLRPEEHPVHAEASGTASDLELALYGRVGFDILDTSGNPRLLEALRIG